MCLLERWNDFCGALGLLLAHVSEGFYYQNVLSVLFFHHVTFLAPSPLSPSCVTHMWSLSLPGSCLCSLGALVSSFLYLFGFLRFSPRNSVPALGQGSACTGTTTGREGWGGWVCPSIALPVGFNLFVCVCVSVLNKQVDLGGDASGDLWTLGGFLIKKTEDSIYVPHKICFIFEIVQTNTNVQALFNWLSLACI